MHIPSYTKRHNRPLSHTIRRTAPHTTATPPPHRKRHTRSGRPDSWSKDGSEGEVSWRSQAYSRDWGGRSTHPVSPTATPLYSPTSAQPGPLHAARRPHDHSLLRLHLRRVRQCPARRQLRATPPPRRNAAGHAAPHTPHRRTPPRHQTQHACTHARMHARTHARTDARTHARMHARTHACTHCLPAARRPPPAATILIGSRCTPHALGSLCSPSARAASPTVRCSGKTHFHRREPRGLGNGR